MAGYDKLTDTKIEGKISANTFQKKTAPELNFMCPNEFHALEIPVRRSHSPILGFQKTNRVKTLRAADWFPVFADTKKAAGRQRRSG